MKQYRILSRDTEFSKAWPKIAEWYDWQYVFEGDEGLACAKAKIENNKKLDKLEGLNEDDTEYKIQKRSITDWVDHERV
jgi:hypothetical protein